MKRTFIGIPMEASPELRQSVLYLQRELVMEPVKWVEMENLHLTLKFLGDTQDDQINAISERISPIFSHGSIMRKNLTGLNFFSAGGIPSVLYSEIGNTFELGEIATQVEQELASLGFREENRPFKPHLTLARIKYLHDMARFKMLVKKFAGHGLGEVNLDRAVFYESMLQSSGPKYVPLKVFPFRIG